MGEPQVKRMPFSPQEDSIILEHVQQHGPAQWQLLAKTLANGRTAKSCRLRWYNELSPGIDKSPISQQEMDFIMQQLIQRGTKWSIISKALVNAGYPKRTDNAIKNLYHVKLKRIVQEQTGLTHNDLQQLAGRKKAREQVHTVLESTPSDDGTNELSDGDPDELPVGRTNSAPAAALLHHLNKGPRRTVSCLGQHLVGHKRTSSSIIDDKEGNLLNHNTLLPGGIASPSLNNTHLLAGGSASGSLLLPPPSGSAPVSTTAAGSHPLQLSPHGSGGLLASGPGSGSLLASGPGSGSLLPEGLEPALTQVPKSFATPLASCQLRTGLKTKKAAGAQSGSPSSLPPSPYAAVGGLMDSDPAAQPLRHVRVTRLRSNRDLPSQQACSSQLPQRLLQLANKLGSNTANAQQGEPMQVSSPAGHALTISGNSPRGEGNPARRVKPNSTDSVYSTQQPWCAPQNDLSMGQAYGTMELPTKRTSSLCSSPSFARAQSKMQPCSVDQAGLRPAQNLGCATALEPAGLPSVSKALPQLPTLAGSSSTLAPPTLPHNNSPFSSQAAVHGTAQLQQAADSSLAELSSLISAQVALTDQLSGQLSGQLMMTQASGSWFMTQRSTDAPARNHQASGSHPAPVDPQQAQSAPLAALAPSTDLDMAGLSLSPGASCHACGAWAHGAAEAAQDLFGQSGPAQPHPAPTPQSGLNSPTTNPTPPQNVPMPQFGLNSSTTPPHSAPLPQFGLNSPLNSSALAASSRATVTGVLPPGSSTGVQTTTLRPTAGELSMLEQMGHASQCQESVSAPVSGNMVAMAEELAWSKEAASNLSLGHAGNSTDSSGLADLLLLNSSMIMEQGLALPLSSSSVISPINPPSPGIRQHWQGLAPTQQEAAGAQLSLSRQGGHRNPGEPSSYPDLPLLGSGQFGLGSSELPLCSSGLSRGADSPWPDRDKLEASSGVEAMALDLPE